MPIYIYLHPPAVKKKLLKQRRSKFEGTYVGLSQWVEIIYEVADLFLTTCIFTRYNFDSQKKIKFLQDQFIISKTQFCIFFAKV